MLSVHHRYPSTTDTVFPQLVLQLRATIKRDVSAIQFSMDSEYLVCADLHEVVHKAAIVAPATVASTARCS